MPIAVNFQFPNGFSRKWEQALKAYGLEAWTFNSLTDSHSSGTNFVPLVGMNAFNSLTDSHLFWRVYNKVAKELSFNSLTDSHRLR